MTCVGSSRFRLSLRFDLALVGVLLFSFSSVTSVDAKVPGVKNKPQSAVDVIIVGAGISGLSTAYYLQKAGISYRILESSAHLGGRIHTASYGNHRAAEAGLEEIWEENPVLEIIRDLKVPIEKYVTTFSSYLNEGKLLAFTQKTNQDFMRSLFSPEELEVYKNWDRKMIELYRLAQSHPKDPLLIALQNRSFSDWVLKESGLSKRLADFVRIQSEPEYGTDWTQISAVEGVAEWHIFSGDGQNSYHVKGGNQNLADQIAKKIGLSHIELNHRVTQIKTDTTGVTVTTSDASRTSEHTFHSRYVVTTLPLFRIPEIQWDPPLPPQKQEAIQSQAWGSFFVAHLLLDRTATSYWNFKEESLLPILSDSPLGVIYEGIPISESHKQVIINLLISGSAAEAWNYRQIASNQMQIEVRLRLEKLWPGISSLIRGYEFFPIHPRAIASWPVGRSRYDGLSSELKKPFGRVYFAGDFTEGTHSHDALKSAIRVSQDIIHLRKL